ncbi:MAG: HNH endonuclease [Actinobacteria bacterium]|nr:HNH endonuclease [Actinomycetota bacterium]
MVVERGTVAVIEEEVVMGAVLMVTCGGCRSQSYASACSRYRSKVWCGSDACRSIIDRRRSVQNRRKRMRKKERGVFYKGVPPCARHHVLKRDEVRCALCGSSNRQNLQVHHIRPRSEDGSDRHTNLITLCREDHDMVHLDMDRYRVLLSSMAIRREVDHMFSARQIARRQDQAIRRRRRESEGALRRCER